MQPNRSAQSQEPHSTADLSQPARQRAPSGWRRPVGRLPVAGMSAASVPAAFARLPHSLRAGSRFVAALCLALLCVLALPALAQAQTTFVSNTGKGDRTSDTIIGTTSFYAQEFTAGSGSGGFTLTEVVVDIRGGSTGTPAFSLYTSANGIPGTKVVDLTGSIASAGEQSFTPASATTLSESTKYFVVAGMSSGSGNLQRTNSGAEDPGKAAGWSINNGVDISSDGGTTWSGTNSASMKIAIKGNPVTPTVTVPGPPTGLTATKNGATQIDLAWTAPTDNGGAAITGYRIEVSDAGSSWSDHVADTGSTDTTYEHTGLSAGTTRHYRVSAINSEGAGAASNEDSATTVSAPSRPRNVITTAGNSQATVIWNASRNDGGAPLDCYQIRRKKTADTDYGNWGTCRGGSGGVQYSALITGLDNGTEYSFQVRARNSAGLYSMESAAATVTPRTTPGAPPSLAASGGDGEVTLNWGAADPRGAAVSSYQYRYKTTGTYPATWTTVSGGGAARSATVSGLANGTLHTFQVRAQNSAGGGTESNEATATPTGTTTTTEPGPPRSLNASGGDGRVSLSWLAPTSNGGAAISSYQVHYKTTGGYGGWTTVIGGGAARSVTVPGLTNGTLHTFQVRARNSVGPGPESNQATTTPTADNAAPTFTEGATASRTVEENASSGTAVGTPLTATDTDAGDSLERHPRGDRRAVFHCRF